MSAEETSAFAQKMGTVMNHGFLAMGIELGDKLGLFDYLLKSGNPQTCQEIADGMGYKERYVREWLGVVTCGGIVDVADDKFSIPEYRAPFLSTKSPTTMARFSWVMSMCSGVTEDIIECFKKDGPKGVPYAKYPTFHSWREALVNSAYTEDEVLKSVSEVPGLLAKLEKGITMCDFGCSSGAMTIKLARRFPNTQVYGYDILESALKEAKEKAEKLGLTNVHFAVQDVCNMPADWSNKWDYAYIYDAVHDVPESAKFLSEIHRVVKPGCCASIIDIYLHTNMAENVELPHATFVYGISLFHCMPVSLDKDGMGLGAAWGVEKANTLMKAAGFSKVDMKIEENDTQVYYTCTK